MVDGRSRKVNSIIEEKSQRMQKRSNDRARREKKNGIIFIVGIFVFNLSEVWKNIVEETVEKEMLRKLLKKFLMKKLSIV